MRKGVVHRQREIVINDQQDYSKIVVKEKKMRQWSGNSENNSIDDLVLKTDRETAEMFINDMLCKVKQRSKLGQPHFNMRRREELLRMWDNNRANIGNNQWALYNTFTEWATHTDHLGSPENARRLRENEIAKAMNSTRWYAL